MIGSRIVVAALAALTPLAVAGSALAAPPSSASDLAASAVQRSTDGKYPIVFQPSGQWALTYTRPGHPTEHLVETFAAETRFTSTFGYQVYRSTECDLDHPGPVLDGKIWAEFYVYPNGMLFSGLRPANGPTQIDGDMGTLSGQAPNDTSVPLVFSGPWLNARGPGGTFTLSRLARPVPCPTAARTGS